MVVHVERFANDGFEYFRKFLIANNHLNSKEIREVRKNVKTGQGEFVTAGITFVNKTSNSGE